VWSAEDNYVILICTGTQWKKHLRTPQDAPNNMTTQLSMKLELKIQARSKVEFYQPCGW
jgi:hypothetical protein